MITILSLFVSAAFQSTVQRQIIVDPLMITMVEEIWASIGKGKVWPGWDPRSTPILIYLPGKQDLLINHPKPPPGFQKYVGPIRSTLGEMFIRNGSTLLEYDGQNTSMPVNGVETLVVADTLSTRRQWIESLAPTLAERPYDSNAVISNGLYPDPYATMTLFAHEAFHVFQSKRAKGAGANELALGQYPSLSVENNVGLSQESEILSEVITAKEPSEVRRLASEWLAVRLERRKSLPASSIAYEDAVELNEGLAKYVEYRTLDAFRGRNPRYEAFLIQGFQGYEGIDDLQKGLRQSMIGFMSGSSTVNNDLFGSSPVRFRLYYSGMGAALLLDRLGVDWKSKVLEGGKPLTAIAEEALKGAIPKPPKAPESVIVAKRKLAEEGKAHVSKELAALDSAPGQLVIDYSKLHPTEPQFSFTPFGILRVDDDRCFFRLIPLSGRVGTTKFREETPRPALWDRLKKQIILQLTAIPAQLPTLEKSISFGGVTIEGAKGDLSLNGRKVVLTLTQ